MYSVPSTKYGATGANWNQGIFHNGLRFSLYRNPLGTGMGSNISLCVQRAFITLHIAMYLCVIQDMFHQHVDHRPIAPRSSRASSSVLVLHGLFVKAYCRELLRLLLNIVAEFCNLRLEVGHCGQEVLQLCSCLSSARHPTIEIDGRRTNIFLFLGNQRKLRVSCFRAYLFLQLKRKKPIS